MPVGAPAPRAVGEQILAMKATIAGALVDQEFARHPELVERYGAIGREKSLQDAGYHLSYLAEAVSMARPQLFVDYIGWAKIMLARRGVLASDLAFHLECMRDVLTGVLPEDVYSVAAEPLTLAIEQLPALPDEIATFIEPGHPLSLLTHQYLNALLRGDRHDASTLVLTAVKDGVTVRDLYLHLFQRVQREIGRLWQTNQISVAQEHYCTAATQLIMSQLYPYIFQGAKNGGTFVGTCVAGDLHEIGVRMVADFFEMAGWHTYYLGANTPASSVVQTVIERQAHVLGISATITYHVRAVEALIKAVRANPACADVVILVGGYPFNQSPDLSQSVGADGYAADADGAIQLAGTLTGFV